MKKDDDRFDDNKDRNLQILQSVNTKEILNKKLWKRQNKLLRTLNKQCPQLNNYQELENSLIKFY